MCIWCPRILQADILAQASLTAKIHAGSPTETLLRLLLPPSDKVHDGSWNQKLSTASVRIIHRITQSVGTTIGVSKGQGRNQHELMTRAYLEFLVEGDWRWFIWLCCWFVIIILCVCVYVCVCVCVCHAILWQTQIVHPAIPCLSTCKCSCNQRKLWRWCGAACTFPLPGSASLTGPGRGVTRSPSAAQSMEFHHNPTHDRHMLCCYNNG